MAKVAANAIAMRSYDPVASEIESCTGVTVAAAANPTSGKSANGSNTNSSSLVFKLLNSSITIPHNMLSY